MKKLTTILVLGAANLAMAASAPMAPLPGMPLDQAPSGLLKNARIEPEHSWDISFNAAFNEYYVAQDGLGLSLSNNGVNQQGPIIAFDFSYHPGFQVGFTLNTPYDDWVIVGEYLWLRSSNHLSATALPGGFLFSTITFPGGGLSNFFYQLEAKWSLGMDLADLSLSRSFYLGTAWTMESFFGLRGGRIRQYLHATELDGPDETASILQASFKSNAWAIGPMAGMQSNWLLGQGFSFFGNLSASLLYMHYTTISDKNQQTTSLLLGTNNNSNSLSPNLDTGLGLKWGSYLGRSFYLDFSAAYNFSVFFSQDQIMSLNALFGAIAGRSPGRLYVHGVSLASGLAF